MQPPKNIEIADSEFTFTFARSSGPGGQHVNKTNTKAVLAWNVLESPSLSEGVRQRFLAKYQNRISADGVISIQCDEFRDRPRNIQGCIDRLYGMIQVVLVPPKPRKKTKPSKAAKQKRLTLKKQHSERKEGRKKINY